MFFPSFFETTNKLQIHVVLYKWFMSVSNNTLGTKVDAYIDRGNISKTCINNQELKRIDILWHPSMHNMLFESHKSLGGRREFLVPKGHRPGIGRLPCDQSLWNMKEKEALSREKAGRVLGQWISMGFYQMLWVNSQIEDHIVFSQNCHNHYLHQ